VDQLTGGAGIDEFVFLNDTDGTLEVDEVLDYASEDFINLDELLLASPTFDPLDPGAEISLVADGDDRIIQVGGVDIVRLADIGGIDNYVDTINVFFEHNEVIAISNMPTV
jgi:Ca2+-binding RTX toxin-like protein